MNAVEQLATIGMIFFIGALAALAKHFLDGAIETHWKRIAGVILSGGTSGIGVGLFVALFAPERRNDALLLAGAAVFAGHVGWPVLVRLALAVIKKRLPKDMQADLEKIDNSLDLKNALDTGEYTAEEIQEAMQKMKAIKAKREGSKK